MTLQSCKLCHWNSAVHIAQYPRNLDHSFNSLTMGNFTNDIVDHNNLCGKAR